jgi:hypothetical protein
MRSVRLPIVVPHGNGNARMNSACEVSLRFRGRRVAVVRGTRRGVQAVRVTVLSGQGAGCVNRQRLGNHKVPRSRASSGRRSRGLARPGLSSSSSVRGSGVCRCRRGPSARFLHVSRPTSLNVMQPASLGLYSGVPAAYGGSIMRQPNYAFERTAKKPRNVWRHRAAAQRER